MTRSENQGVCSARVFLRACFAAALAFACAGFGVFSAAPFAFAEEAPAAATNTGATDTDATNAAATNAGAADTEESLPDELHGIAEGKADGTYYGSGEGYQSTVTVSVTVEDGRITAVKVVSHADDAAYIERAAKLIPNIIDQQTADVDVMSGCTYSSRGIIAAVKDAINGSGAASLVNGMFFSVGMIVLAVALFAAAVICALRCVKAKSRKDARKITSVQRWCIQGMFFILAPSAFATAFIGLKTLFMQINVMNTHRGYDFEVMSFTILLVVLLVFSALLGRFFCGYACGFGFLGDVLYTASNALTKKLHIKRPELPRVALLILRSIKYVVLVAVCAVVLAGFYTDVNAASPWTVFSKLINLSTSNLSPVAIGLLIAVVVLMLLRERAFCEFFCPLGAIFSLLPTPPTGRMRRERPKCLKGCSACRSACPVSIEPKQKVLAGECIMCARCQGVCPTNNIVSGLEVRADAPEQARTSLWAKINTHAGSVLWKAVILLALLWFMKATRFLPIFFD